MVRDVLKKAGIFPLTGSIEMIFKIPIDPSNDVYSSLQRKQILLNTHRYL